MTADLYYRNGSLGTLEIPSIGLSVNIYQGTDALAPVLVGGFGPGLDDVLRAGGGAEVPGGRAVKGVFQRVGRGHSQRFYNATASYTGTATSKYATGYVITAEYAGEVVKTISGEMIKPSSVVTSRVAASWGMILSMSLVPLSRVTVSVCSLVSIGGYLHETHYAPAAGGGPGLRHDLPGPGCGSAGGDRPRLCRPAFRQAHEPFRLCLRDIADAAVQRIVLVVEGEGIDRAG